MNEVHKKTFWQISYFIAMKEVVENAKRLTLHDVFKMVPKMWYSYSSNIEKYKIVVTPLVDRFCFLGFS